VQDLPVVIDCVEFSDELRTVDVADDLNVLAMECDLLGAKDLGALLMRCYRSRTGDQIPNALAMFYRTYRACVRAKVAALRAQQSNVSMPMEAAIATYLAVAEQCAAKICPHMLIVVGGLMGTGKSTLANGLGNAFEVEVLSTDHIRHEMLGASSTPAEYGEGIYVSDLRMRVYAKLFHEAKLRLKHRESVILDGTFLSIGLREKVYELANKYGAAMLYVHCACPRDTAYARIQERVESSIGESEARTELYDLQARDSEPPWADEPAVVIDSCQSIPQQVKAVCAALQRVLFPTKLRQ
jgi:predicted kinase